MATVRDLSDILNDNGQTKEDNKRPASFLEKAVKEQNEQATDPARDIAGSAPNFGKFPIPHVMSFQGMAGTFSKVYHTSDEALRDSRENARFMRNDCGIMECIEARQRCTALLDWHLEPEDENSTEQVALVDELTKIMTRMNRFTEYRFNLLHAIWYGRYAVQHRYRWMDVSGRMRVLPAPFRDNPGWMPINGDKLVFRYDDGSGTSKPDQVGIRVGGHMSGMDRVSGRWEVEPTQDGLAYFLKDWERPLLAIHKHTIEDGSYENIQDGGMVHGVGIRSRIYWDWFQKQECLAFLMEYLERSAGGIEIWYYPQGNAEAEAKAREAAEERIANQRNIVLVPKPMGDDAHAFGVEVIEPGMGGIDALQNILNEYYGHRIKRYILGQTLSSEAQATGLGSGLAELHLDTFLQIIKYDSINLEETLTHQLVKNIKDWNFPAAKDIHVDFKIDVEQQDVGEKLSAWQMAWQMGAKLKEGDVMELIGAAMPTQQDRVLEQPEQPEMGGMGGGGMFPGMDPMGGQQPPPQGGVEQMDRVDDEPPPPPDVDRDTDSVLRDLFGEASVDGQTVTYVTSDGKWVQKDIPFDTGDRKRAENKIVTRHSKWTSEDESKHPRGDDGKFGEGSGDSDDEPRYGESVTPKIDVTRQHIEEMRTRLRTKGLSSKIARREPGEGDSVSLTLEEVDDLLKNGIIGLMSAGKNPNLEPDMSSDEESDRHAQLMDDLKQRGFMFTEGRGMYEGHEEHSVMVMIPESSRSEMVELGEKYNQDSVIWSDGGENHFVYTTGDNAGQSHTGNGFDYRKDASDYFTEFCEEGGENCSKFLLEFDFDTMAQAKYERSAAEWVEAQHPREEDGTFADRTGGGGGRPGSGEWRRREETERKEKDPSKASVSETPAERRKGRKTKPIEGGSQWVMTFEVGTPGEEDYGTGWRRELGPAAVKKSLSERRGMAMYAGVDLTNRQKKTIDKVVSKLTNRLSTRAARRLEKNLTSFNFHDSVESMEHSLGARAYGDFFSDHTPMAMHDKSTFSVHFASPDSYPKHPKLSREALSAHTYAYALWSAVDGGAGHFLSKTDEWKEAWESELSSRELTDHASDNAKKGFAEFGRMVTMRKLSPAMRKAFPRCVKYFERQELIDD